MEKCSFSKVNIHRIVTNEELKNLDAEAERERINWAERLLKMPAVWNRTKGVGVKVAILDTGIDIDHPDFNGAIVATRDFTGDGIEDINGHGTHVAGIIGARHNGIGFVGVAPECKLIIGKVLSNSGSGRYSWIADGIRWATDNGAQIINMSLGGPGSTKGLYEAIHYALYKGVIICVAAGNEGSLFENSIGFPGRYGGVITVASHDRNGNRSGFSSSGGEIDFMAPGSNIWSTYKDGRYAELSGTSMATPFVSGICALILSKHINTPDNGTPIYNTSDMKEHLLKMASHPGWHDNIRGYGPLLPFRHFVMS